MGSWEAWLRRRITSAVVWKVDVPITLVSILVGAIELLSILLSAVASVTMLLAPVFHSYDIDVMVGPWSAGTWFDAWLMAITGIVPAIAALGVLTCGSLARDAAVTWIGRSDAQEIRRELDSVRRNRARIVAGFEVERRRIERDLHDGVQQDLLALTITLGLLQHSALSLKGPQANSIHPLITRAREQAEHATSVLRDTVHGIHPRELTDYGLDAALRQLIDRSPLTISYRASGADDRVPVAAASAIYYAIAELLSNVTKHAATNLATVTVKIRKQGVYATVCDHGLGGAMHPSSAAFTPSSGLTGLKERLASVDGNFHFVSPPGKGTTATLFVPIISEDSEREDYL